MDVLDLFRLDGQVAVVTGGGTGIGRGIALGLAGAGARVVVAGRRPEPLREVVAEIQGGGGQALAVTADVTVPADLERVAAGAAERFGRLDIWVSNAGGLQGVPLSPLTELSEDDWAAVTDLNLTSVWRAAKVAERALPDGGVIVNVASLGGLVNGAPRNGVYTAAKAAVIHLTKTLALELAPRRIRVNALAPGQVATADYYRASGFTDAQFDKLASKQPLGRLGRDEDFAAAVVYLASPASAWVTGHTLVVAGHP